MEGTEGTVDWPVLLLVLKVPLVVSEKIHEFKKKQLKQANKIIFLWDKSIQL